MKIGFFGNANNYPFLLARSLRSMGHDVQFIVDRQPREKWERLNRPENRFNDITLPYPEWVHDLSPIDLWSISGPSENLSKVIRLLQSCDAIILNEFGLGLGAAIDRPYIALLTGTDLEVLADYRYAFSLTPEEPQEYLSSLRKYYLKLIDAQRDGIRNAVAVVYFPKGMLPQADSLLAEIGVTGSQRVNFMMTDTDKIQFHPPPYNKIVRIFNVARLTWKKPENLKHYVELDYKGSDVMIRGLGKFVRSTGVCLDIRLVRKGANINETVDLIREEGLTDMVRWTNELTQQQVFEEYRNADIVFEQLGQGMVGMGALDAMAVGRPVIANGRPEIMNRIIGEPSPICQAATPEEVCAQLVRLVKNRNEYQLVAAESRRYVEMFFSSYRGACIVLERLYDRLCHHGSTSDRLRWQLEAAELQSMLRIKEKMDNLFWSKQKMMGV